MNGPDDDRDRRTRGKKVLSANLSSPPLKEHLERTQIEIYDFEIEKKCECFFRDFDLTSLQIPFYSERPSLFGTFRRTTLSMSRFIWPTDLFTSSASTSASARRISWYLIWRNIFCVLTFFSQTQLPAPWVLAEDHQEHHSYAPLLCFLFNFVSLSIAFSLSFSLSSPSFSKNLTFNLTEKPPILLVGTHYDLHRNKTKGDVARGPLLFWSIFFRNESCGGGVETLSPCAIP